MNRQTGDQKDALTDPGEALAALVSEKARNLYSSRQLLCTESVMVALNQGLGGGLTDRQAVAMAAPFSAAMGESGCMCGALSGAVMVSGLFLGDGHPYRHRKEMRDSARQLHDAFRAAHGATCCRVLSQKIAHDRQAHFNHCAELTAESARMAARLILNKRPELIRRIDQRFLSRRNSGLTGALLNLIRRLMH